MAFYIAIWFIYDFLNLRMSENWFWLKTKETLDSSEKYINLIINY